MSYHDWLVLKALAIFVLGCVFLLVGALVERYNRRRRVAVAGADLPGQPAVTPEPGLRNAHRARALQPRAAERRVRAQHPATA